MLFDIVEGIVGFFIRNGASALVTGAAATLLDCQVPPLKNGIVSNIIGAPIRLLADSIPGVSTFPSSNATWFNGAVVSLIVQPVADIVRKVSGMTTVSGSSGLQQYSSLVSHSVVTYASYRLVMQGLFDLGQAEFTSEGGIKWVAALTAGDLLGASVADGVGGITGLDYDYI